MGQIESLIAWSALGDLEITEFGSEHGRRYGRELLSSARAPGFSLYLPLEGEGIVRQDGREALLHGGDFILCDGARPHEVQLHGGSRMLALVIPTLKIRRYIACPESLPAIPMRAPTGVSRLLSGFLRNFWVHCRQSVEDAAAAQIAVAILELLGAAYAVVPRTSVERSVRRTTHRIRILNHIHAHLYDPELTPIKIAAACGITTRYLHYLFTEDDETVTRYILKCRLDACSQALLSGSQCGRTVTSIAFDHGFNSATHFGRVFRSYFGTTPRKFRAQGVGAGRHPRQSEAPVAVAAGY